MKQFFITALLGLGCSSVVLAAPDQLYHNLGVVTNVPTIDATIFWNDGIFDLNTVVGISNINNSIGNGSSSIPFSTRDTLYFTNTGTMTDTPGFLLDTVTATTRHSASSFVNHGAVTGFDVPGFPEIDSTTTGTTALVAYSQPETSQVEILATNILNDGTISVGNYGLLQMVGNTITNVNGALVAGALNTGGGDGLDFDPLDTTGDNDLFYIGFDYYVNPPGVYDLFWGVTNAGTLNLSEGQLNPPFTTEVKVTDRFGGTGPEALPLNFNGNFASYVEVYPSSDPSNTYVNMVFVNTNFTDNNGQTDTNITVNVGFSYDYTILASEVGDLKAKMAMVQFAVTVPDVITGQTVTNAVYLLDAGGAFSPMIDYDNAGDADGYSRANAFVTTTTTPFAWLDDNEPSNFVYTPELIYEDGVYSSKTAPYEAAEYGAQIGRNPGEVDGSFDFDSGFGSEVALPDPTNEVGRIELTANQLDLSNARLRAEGMVIVNATNFGGTATAGSDWGQINSQLGATNGSLVISNFYPVNFQRLRGDIYAYSATWENTATNNTVIPGFTQTNTFHYHLLVVDQNLGANFQSAIRNLSLTGTNSVVVYDPLYVINQEYFNTSNLTFNSNVVFTQNAGNLFPANMPTLQYFLNNSNASLSVDSVLDMGYNVTKLPVAPDKLLSSSVLGITNLGAMTATAPIFQSRAFENDGSITADNGGSMTIEAYNLGLGEDSTNATNILLADGNITLSGVLMGFYNSQIFAGGMDGLGQGSLLLQTAADGFITDFVQDSSGTNSPLVNFWQVTDGFSLPVMPVNGGDLFGTEITTIATGFTVAEHVWAGVDFSADPILGFEGGNMVIGHLKLSRQTNTAALHFTGAGADNGMYVDYLELDTNSLSGQADTYRDGLIIDPNLTIYFAACNVDPIKVESIAPNRLVWVPSFAGPNSSVSVPYTNCLGVTQYCLMNANLAFSPDIAFFPPVPNIDNQPFVLNDPTGDCANVDTNFCSASMFNDFILKDGVGNYVNVVLSTVGGGSISPALKPSEVALGRQYTLTATPSNGWVFSGWSAKGLAEDNANMTSRVLKFMLEGNLTLTANFTPEPFTLVKGAYYGLFTNSAPASGNSGWFTFTLGQNGALSGRLLIGPATYTFSSVFPTSGTAHVIATCDRQSLAVTLSLDLADPDGQVVGSVTDGNAWSSPLLGYLASTAWTTKKPSPYAGRYTMVLTNNGTNGVAAGDSYGTLIVSQPGVLSVAGKLADGNAFSQSVPISTNGLWPFYTYVAAGHDSVLGWIAFQGNDLSGVTLGETNLFWSKAAFSKALYYPAGFSNMFELAGSPYAIPGKDSSGLALENRGDVILSGGGLAEVLANPVVYNGKLMYSDSKLTLSINPTVGSFTGQLQDPADGPPINMSGVVLQKQDGAFGFFLGTNHESGAVLLQAQ